LLLAAVVLGCAGVVAAAVHDDESTKTAAPGPRTDQDGATTTSGVPEATTTTAPGTAVATASTTPNPTTTVRRTTTTAARRTTGAPATTNPPAAATPTSAAPVPTAAPACTTGQIGITASVDRPNYLPSQVVTVTSTLRNQSAQTCFYRGYSFATTFKDPAGQSLGGENLVADDLQNTALAPGQTITHTAHWDHRSCPATITCGYLPSGAYSATATWSFAGAPYMRMVAVILL
jgi:hypothetical protein